MKPVNEKTLDLIGQKLLKAGQTIAVAESVTSGCLQVALSSIMDAGKFYQGGITVYNVAQKFKHLRVEPIHALAVNAVSQKVAHEMAKEVCGLFGSDWGVGVAGYASPVPESGLKTFAYFSICCQGKIKAHGKLNLKGQTPASLQQAYTSAIIHKLSKVL